jgi:glycosyltransferase involved in cell wall biosynthesis
MTAGGFPVRRILLYGDFRSPHAHGMRDGLVAAGHEVLAVSSEVVDCPGVLSPKDFLSRVRQRGATMARSPDSYGSTRLARSVSVIQTAHTVLDLARLPARRSFLRRVIRDFNPDVVHALRLPYEGLTALSTTRRVPVVVSTWGSDFEPMASRDVILRSWLKLMLPRARGIHVDKPGDYRRALEYGFKGDAPHLYSAGNFGIDSERFHRADLKEKGLVVYARRPNPGFNYRGFVKAILELDPSIQYRAVGVGLAEVRNELVAEFGENTLERIDLTERLATEEFAELMRKADIVVSPAYWDGTPNSVIEAYVCGCSVVVGRLPQFEDLVKEGLDLHLVDIESWHGMHQRIQMLLTQEDNSSVSRVLPLEFDRVANEARFSALYEQILKP